VAVVVVVVGTDHEDTEEAVRSVSGAMKRAGYDLLDYSISETPSLVAPDSRAVIEVCEPEVNPRAKA